MNTETIVVGIIVHYPTLPRGHACSSLVLERHIVQKVDNRKVDASDGYFLHENTHA